MKPKDWSDDPETLGEFLKARRRKLGLLQKDVAVLLGVSPFTIGNWEKEHTSPSIGLWPAIIEFLGHDPNPAAGTLAEKTMAVPGTAKGRN